MHKRRLGRTDLLVSQICLGSMTWGQQNTEADGHAQMDLAFSRGVNFIDTAELYPIPPKAETQGWTERIIGSWLKAKRNRDQMILASKVVGRTANAWFRGGRPSKLVRADIFDAVEKSLTRLNTDYIDLYITHWQDPTTPIAETMEALERLKSAGKIRAIGASNLNTGELQQYAGAGQLDAIQERYSMLDREIEQTLLPIARQHQVAALSYSSLALGLLSGAIDPAREFSGDDQRKSNPRFSQANRRKVAALKHALAPVAEVYQASMAQIVIAWTLAQPGITFALCGARNAAQALDNARAGEISLSAAELTAIDAAVAVNLVAIDA
ncbi:MAG: aldo/keto reductase [Mesorhizobium sp.]|nr:MAG: aldo/keto reductase [Mesorhizobium sp.]